MKGGGEGGKEGGHGGCGTCQLNLQLLLYELNRPLLLSSCAPVWTDDRPLLINDDKSNALARKPLMQISAAFQAALKIRERRQQLRCTLENESNICVAD